MGTWKCPPGGPLKGQGTSGRPSAAAGAGGLACQKGPIGGNIANSTYGWSRSVCGDASTSTSGRLSIPGWEDGRSVCLMVRCVWLSWPWQRPDQETVEAFHQVWTAAPTYLASGTSLTACTCDQSASIAPVHAQAAIDGDQKRLLELLSTKGQFRSNLLLESRNSAGWTALMWAAWHNKVPAMRTLVEAGAMVNATDRYGQTALSLAAENSNGAQELAVSLLLDSGADPSVCGYEGKTPAEWAAKTV